MSILYHGFITKATELVAFIMSKSLKFYQRKRKPHPSGRGV